VGAIPAFARRNGTAGEPAKKTEKANRSAWYPFTGAAGDGHGCLDDAPDKGFAGTVCSWPAPELDHTDTAPSVRRLLRRCSRSRRGAPYFTHFTVMLTVMHAPLPAPRRITERGHFCCADDFRPLDSAHVMRKARLLR